MEVGTGWGVQTPICFFLCGVDSVVTFDQHRYLKASIVMDSVKMLVGDTDRVVNLLASITDPKQLRERLQLLASCETCDEVLRAARITYRAPADASHTDLPDHSIDLQISNNVLEHIPHEALTQILREANRVLTPSGVTVHRLGPSDHFSEDPSILPINFLRYTQEEWDRLADNQFAYHNRLRASDYQEIYTAAGHQIVEWKPTVHTESVNALKTGFPVAPQFQGKSPEDLSTVLLQIVSRPSNGVAAVTEVLR
jgi:SAM-dependent methyltransferase